MNTYTFFKENGGWHVQMPAAQVLQKTSKVDLVDGADSMLNLMADGSERVTLTMNTEPFENAEVFELLQSCQPFLDGGYYLLREHGGKKINHKMWISDVTQMAFGALPEKIYVKKAVAE